MGLGRQKIFEVRKLYNDVTFLDEFFTEEFCADSKFFSFSFNERTERNEIDSREFKKVKNKLLSQLTNFGEPFIAVQDANHENRGELLLHHKHEGTDLHVDNAHASMVALQRIWRRPVHLVTVLEEKKRMLSYDGKERTSRSA